MSSQLASALWESTIASDEDLISLSIEIDSLISSFEGLEKDLEDLLVMRKSIKIFRDCYESIQNKQTTWEQFDALKENLISECNDQLSDEEIPWDYEQVISEFHNSESTQRKIKSKDWIDEIMKNESKISKMNAAEANQLVNLISSPPLYITTEHQSVLANFNEMINARISDLSIEWLIEKFKELSLERKSEFISIANNLIKK